MTPDCLQLTPFCRYFSFVAASSSSFSKSVFLRCRHFWLGILAIITVHSRLTPLYDDKLARPVDGQSDDELTRPDMGSQIE